MEDYFGYDVIYCMNVTDVNDKVISVNPSLLFLQPVVSFKIIERAREQYLYRQFTEDRSLNAEKCLEDCRIALEVRRLVT